MNKTILIIEDNVLNLAMATDLLKRDGFETLEAEDVDTGISLAKLHQPDLILMDIHLPIKNGYEASQILKSDPQTGHIPIVAFTAMAMTQEVEKAKEYGCTGVISKPIDVDSFAGTVASYIP